MECKELLLKIRSDIDNSSDKVSRKTTSQYVCKYSMYGISKNLIKCMLFSSSREREENEQITESAIRNIKNLGGDISEVYKYIGKTKRLEKIIFRVYEIKNIKEDINCICEIPHTIAINTERKDESSKMDEELQKRITELEGLLEVKNNELKNKEKDLNEALKMASESEAMLNKIKSEVAYTKYIKLDDALEDYKNKDDKYIDNYKLEMVINIIKNAIDGKISTEEMLNYVGE